MTPQRNQVVLHTHVSQLIGALTGVPGRGEPMAFTQYEDAVNYANTFGNVDATNGYAVKMQYGPAASPTTLASFDKTRIFLNSHLQLGAGSSFIMPYIGTPDPPGSGFTVLYTKSDGLLYMRTGAAGAEQLAAGLDASGFLGYDPIINGAFESWPQGPAFNSTADGTYTADQWTIARAGTSAVINTTRSTDVPLATSTNGQPSYSLKVAVATADASVAAGDVASIVHKMEGYQFRKLRGRDFVLPFWTRHTVPGTYCVAFSNGVDRTYVATYTQNVADTWEYKTVSVTASPSAGTWDYTTGLGLNIHFVLMAGSNFQATAGQWNSDLKIGTSAQTNALSSTANISQIALVGPPIPGTAALSFISRSFADTLTQCGRYFQKSTPDGTNALAATLNGSVQFQCSDNANAKVVTLPIKFPVEMRGTPVIRTIDFSGNLDKITTYDGSGAATANVAWNVGAVNEGPKGFTFSQTSTIAGFGFGWQATARL